MPLPLPLPYDSPSNTPNINSQGDNAQTSDYSFSLKEKIIKYLIISI